MKITKAFLIGLAVSSVFVMDAVAKSKEKPLEKSDIEDVVTEEQREAMQTRVLEGDPETIYAAFVSVIQVEAWTIDKVDKDLGLLQATSLKSSGGVSPAKDWVLKIEDEQARMRTLKKYERKNLRLLAWTRWLELTARIESGKEGMTRVRLIIVKAGTLPTMNRSKPDFWTGISISSRAGSEESVILEDAGV